MVDPVKKDNIFWIFYRFGNSGGIAFEYFGVYYKDIMYYLSTNPNMNVVKHFLDEGKVNTVIENSGIPNQHFLASITSECHSIALLSTFFEHIGSLEESDEHFLDSDGVVTNILIMNIFLAH